MDKFIEKISSYNILNNMLPGVVAIFVFELIYQCSLLSNDIIENAFIYYFVGMIFSRVGSLIVEPLAKMVKLVKYAPYKDYISACKKDNEIKILLETNNVYRTLLGIMIVSGIMFVANYIIKFNSLTCIAIAICVLTLLFAISYKKQTEYIVKRINIANDKGENNNDNY